MQDFNQQLLDSYNLLKNGTPSQEKKVSQTPAVMISTH